MKYLENLHDVTAIMPDFVGFIFYPESQRYVVPDRREQLINIVPESIRRIGVFVNESIDKVESEADRLKLDFVQLHGSEIPDYCAALKSAGFRIIKAFGIDENFDFSKTIPYKPHVDYFLFDSKTSKYGGSGKIFDWDTLNNYDQEVPFFLSGGFDLEHLERIDDLMNYNIVAIDVNSRFETEPGLKDISKLKTLKQNLDQFNKKHDLLV